MSDYLWSGSGRPDPEVEVLEERLAPLRREPPPLPDLPARPTRHGPRWRRRVAIPLLLAASLLLVSGLTLLARRQSWEVTWLGAGGGAARLAAGEWLETGERRASLAVGLIGTLRLEPGTRLRLVSVASHDHRVALARGTVHARIWAPPRRFFVETPVTTAIDLGCAYTLSTDEGGNGILRVTSGWVSFERRARGGLDEVAVPAGASCRVLATVGPMAPVWDDAPGRFRQALESHEAAGADPAARQEALATLLASARAKDGLTLLAMAPSLSPAERGVLYDRLAAVSGEVRRLPRGPFVAGEAGTVDALRSALGLPTP